MKTVWIALLLLLTISACLPEKIGKKDDVAPELAGTYQITSLIVNGVTVIPKQGNSGQIGITKLNDTQLRLNLSLTENGTADSDNLGEVTISKITGDQYKMVNGNGAQLGTVDGTTFLLDISSSGGSLYIAAKK